MEKDLRQFDTPLLEVILAEENQKFIRCLETGAPWRELRLVRENIRKLKEVIAQRKEENTSEQNNRYQDRGSSSGAP